MPTWWWLMQIAHYREMQTACALHGDTTSEAIYRQAIESALQWLGQMDERSK